MFGSAARRAPVAALVLAGFLMLAVPSASADSGPTAVPAAAAASSPLSTATVSPVRNSVASSLALESGPAFAGGITLAQYLDSMWEMVSWIHVDAARPTVAVVRVIEASEAATVTAECLRDEGFSAAAATASASVEPGADAEEDPLRYHLALYVCAARYPISA